MPNIFVQRLHEAITSGDGTAWRQRCIVSNNLFTSRILAFL